jgi:isoleucyl-tRNA synthetase
VNAALETKRKEKVIGNSLAAKVTLDASGPTLALLNRYREQLPAVFIVSQVEVRESGTRTPQSGVGGLTITVSRADGVRCDRCWRYVPAR